ncbi:MAG: hypothetical protein RLZZ352_608 [Pseudomonadota bacterium]|jgi:Tfp pilus assembly protein PilX
MDAKLLKPKQFVQRERQKGYVIIIALVVLIVITLSALTLVRTVGASYQIAGNLAFHQGATQAGDRSTEVVLLNYLIPNNAVGNTRLHNNDITNNPDTSNAYFATRADPAANQSWEEFWNATLRDNRRNLGTDAAGNTVEYVIHRLCENTGIAETANCAMPPSSLGAGGTNAGGGGMSISNTQVYYRITTRIEGPRNTVTFTQTIVAL